MRAVRRTLVGGGAMILAALVVLAAVYGARLDVRFEVAGLVLAWLVLAVVGALLTRLFGTTVPVEASPARNDD